MNSTNTDAVLHAWNGDYRRKLIPNTILLLIEFVIGAMGNAIVILMYSIRLKEGKDDRYFIPYLAFLDLLASIFGILHFMLNFFFMAASPSSILCKFVFFLALSTSSASAHTLLAIAVHRFLKVCKPLGKQMTIFWRRLALGLIFILSISYGLPLFKFTDIVDDDGKHANRTVTGYYCSLVSGEYSVYKLVYLIVLLFMNIASIVATSCLYIPIGWIIYKRFKRQVQNDYNKASKSNSGSENTQLTDTRGTEMTSVSREISSKDTKHVLQESQTKRQRASHKSKHVKTNFNLMFVTIVIFYVLAYIPTFIYLFISMFTKNLLFTNNPALMNVYWSMSSMYILNHIINPFIYGYFDMRFRQEVTKILCKCRK